MADGRLRVRHSFEHFGYSVSFRVEVAGDDSGRRVAHRPALFGGTGAFEEGEQRHDDAHQRGDHHGDWRQRDSIGSRLAVNGGSFGEENGAAARLLSVERRLKRRQLGARSTTNHSTNSDVHFALNKLAAMFFYTTSVTKVTPIGPAPPFATRSIDRSIRLLRLHNCAASEYHPLELLLLLYYRIVPRFLVRRDRQSNSDFLGSRQWYATYATCNIC